MYTPSMYLPHWASPTHPTSIVDSITLYEGVIGTSRGLTVTQTLADVAGVGVGAGVGVNGASGAVGTGVGVPVMAAV